MIIQAELKCKQTGCEADPCAVDNKTIVNPDGDDSNRGQNAFFL